MSDWFWKTKYSEFLEYCIWGFYLGLLTFSIGILALLGLPKAVALLAAAVAMFVAPYFLGRRITTRWNKEAPEVIATHPTRFLRKIRDLRRAGLVLQFIALAFLVVYFAGQPSIPELVAQASLLGAFVYFFFIEVILLQTRLSFWRIDPKTALRACLLAEEDEEKLKRESWLDDSLDFFNQIRDKGFELGIAEDLSLDVLLFGSPTRRLYASFLLRDIDSADYLAFVNDISQIAHMPVPEVVGRVGLREAVRKNQSTILSISVPVIFLVASNPWLIQDVVNPIISAWSNLLKSLH